MEASLFALGFLEEDGPIRAASASFSSALKLESSSSNASVSSAPETAEVRASRLGHIATSSAYFSAASDVLFSYASSALQKSVPASFLQHKGHLDLLANPQKQMHWLTGGNRGMPLRDPPSRQARRESFLQTLSDTAPRFYQYHDAKRSILARLAKECRVAWEAREAKALPSLRADPAALGGAGSLGDAAKSAEEIERERIARLRTTDRAAYDELIKRTKAERLDFLMRQTDTYLSNLSELVMKQQQSNVHASEVGVEREAQQAAMEIERQRVVAARRKEKEEAKRKAKEERKRKREEERLARKGVTSMLLSSDAGAMAVDGAAPATAELESDHDHDDDDDDEDDADAEEHDDEATSPSSASASASSSSLEPAITMNPDQQSADVLTRYYATAHARLEKVTTQPSLLVGGELKKYQLAGLEWMVSLYNNSLNGILADDMGLGKTVQTIALISHLIEVKKNRGPFLVTVPLSTLSNWANEFKRWAPAIHVVEYKGSRQERQVIYKTRLAPGAVAAAGGALFPHHPVTGSRMNVLLTTYDYCMKDRSLLRKHYYQFLIVDEGHRLKNAQSKFTQILGQEYQSRNRLLLTGTPLQNSLPELWSLLNFLLPQVFHSVESFESWFSKPFASFKQAGSSSSSSSSASSSGAAAAQQALADELGAGLTQEESIVVIQRLHQVLRPFLLRRTKSQVLSQLPEKTEHVLRCDLSAWQRVLYKQIQHFGCVATDPSMSSSSSSLAGASGSSKGLSNTLVQLRKACNHPYTFVDSYDPTTDLLWRSSGKLELLDRMLDKLHRTGHRVLLFNQMTAVMDILDDYFAMRGYRYLRLDGSTSPAGREERMRLFNAPNSPYFIFSLSTRAGGLGINLYTADTVVLYDSDWNPTADAQAQDRAHRMGQTKEVRVYRLCTTTPVEEKILERAGDKASMEALVIEAGQFSTAEGAASASSSSSSSSAAASGGAGPAVAFTSHDKSKRALLEEIVQTELNGGRRNKSKKRTTMMKATAKPKGGKTGKRGRKSAAAASGDGASKAPADSDNDDGDEDAEANAEGDDDDDGEDDDADGPLTDESLNELLARDEREFLLFQAMDAERCLTEYASYRGKDYAADDDDDDNKDEAGATSSTSTEDATVLAGLGPKVDKAKQAAEKVWAASASAASSSSSASAAAAASIAASAAATATSAPGEEADQDPAAVLEAIGLDKGGVGGTGLTYHRLATLADTPAWVKAVKTANARSFSGQAYLQRQYQEQQKSLQAASAAEGVSGQPTSAVAAKAKKMRSRLLERELGVFGDETTVVGQKRRASTQAAASVDRYDDLTEAQFMAVADMQEGGATEEEVRAYVDKIRSRKLKAAEAKQKRKSGAAEASPDADADDGEGAAGIAGAGDEGPPSQKRARKA